jgi:nucleotide-binding universal stress UspA family protein
MIALHVVDIGLVAAKEGATPPSITSAIEQQTREAIEALLARSDASGEMDVAVVHGSAPTSIVSFAQHQGASALVLATSGRTGADRLVLGSVAERVVRTAPCPVLTVGPRARSLDIRRVAAAVDPFDPSSIAASDVAAEIARLARAELVLVHAWMPALSIPSASEVLIAMDEPRATAIREVVDRLARTGVRVSAHPVVGDPYVEITAAAAQLDTDLLVCGTAQRTGVARFVFGSVAERLVRTSPCPVLTVATR